MPGIVAQGLLFFGFIYCMAYAIRFFEYIFKKKHKPITPIDHNAEKKFAKSEPTKAKAFRTKYKFLLQINSDLAKNNSNYYFLDIKSVKIGDKEICIHDVSFLAESEISIGEIDENIESYWILEIDELNFDETKLKFICISKNKGCKAMSIYSASEVLYDNQRYDLRRIEDLRHLDGYKTAIAFDNWINVTGLNAKPSIMDGASRRIMNK